MARQHIDIGLLVAAACTLLAAAAAESSSPAFTMDNTTAAARSAYGMVLRKGFPVGILPRGVQHYKLVPNGSFTVEFAGDCMFGVAGRHTFYYRRDIAGRIRYRSMNGLKNMDLMATATWRSIERVDRNRDFLIFHVSGGLTQNIDAMDFLVSNSCL